MSNINKTTLSLQPGSEVIYAGRRCYITHLLDFESVLVSSPGYQPERVLISQLQPTQVEGIDAASANVLIVLDDDWHEAQRRFEMIRPFLDPRGRKRADLEAHAAELGIHVNTLYKWLALYNNHGKVSALLPKKRSDKDTKKLPPEIEAIVDAVINTEYLSSQKKSPANIVREIKKRCDVAGLAAPHANTVRKRIAKISEELRLTLREGRKKAEELFSPIIGEFPGADTPLSVWQIDHTKVDIILVDDIHRRSIGRPWITVVIDVFSRMVAGFYISFDPPGALATGLCLANGILPKEAWLAKLGVGSEWPIWGLPAKVHADNAKEFRGNMLKRACQEYAIDLEWRPVAHPHFGGHIERLLGSLGTEIHTLPGTTFSNTHDRGDYDSEAKATLTIAEFEKWLTTLITEVYHQRIHSSLNMSPLDKYRSGIFGGNGKPGTGLPAKIVDEAKLRLDFMPFEERSIQDYGVVMDKIHYYHDVLRRWINATEPDKPKVKRKFLFRRDPRDISVIWFYDPEISMYYQIPYRDISHPPMSIWELREAQRSIKGRKPDEKSERAIFEALDRMRQIEDEAKGKTKAARRAVQRRVPKIGSVIPDTLPKNQSVVDDEVTSMPAILPFDEMDDMSDE
jgi:putative transposase